MRLGSEPVRDRVPVLRDPPAQARPQARAPRRRADRPGDQGDRRRRRAASASPAARRRRTTWSGPGSRSSPSRSRRVLLIVQRAAEPHLPDVGAIVGPVGGEYWRYSPPRSSTTTSATCSRSASRSRSSCRRSSAGWGPPVRVAGPGLRHARHAVRGGVEEVLGDGIPIAAGGNGIALGVLGAWIVMRDADRRRDPTEEYDQIAVAVCAACCCSCRSSRTSPRHGPASPGHLSAWPAASAALGGGGRRSVMTNAGR